MGKKSGPPAPDYTGTANAQAAASQEATTNQTWANRPDQSTPFGNTTWGAQTVKDPTTGQDVTKWTQNTSLDPRMQSALDSQMQQTQGRSDLANGMMGGVQSSLGTPMDWSGFTQNAGTPQATQTGTTTNASAFNYGAPGNIQNSLDYTGAQQVGSAGDTRARAEDALYQSQATRLDQRYGDQQTALETDLANRGISRDSEAYTRAMNDFNTAKNDAYQNASLQAINQGGTEAQRDYGMDMGLRQQQVNEAGMQGQFANSAQAQQYGQGSQSLQNQLAAQQAQFQQGLSANNQNYAQGLSSSNYQNQLRQQQIAEAMKQRTQGLDEMTALMNGQSVNNPTFQNFGQASTSQTPDLLGAQTAQYQAAMGGTSNRNAATGDMLGGLTSLAGMYFSDRRVKRNVRRIGTHPRGFGIYRYSYIGERGMRVGVIAQDVARHVPAAVVSDGGVLKVNYQMLKVTQ